MSPPLVRSPYHAASTGFRHGGTTPMAANDRSIASGVPQSLQPKSSARVTTKCSGMRERNSREKFHAGGRSYTGARAARSSGVSSSSATSAGRRARSSSSTRRTRADHHERVPEGAPADHARGDAGSWLFVKREHPECVGAGTERPAASDIAVPAIGVLRTRAEERDLLRKPRNNTTHALDAPAKGAAVADVVVARKHGHRRVRVAARKLEHAQEHAGAGI